MTPTQVIEARAAVASACCVAGAVALSIRRLRTLPRADFDRWLQIAFVVSRVGLFALLFLVLRMPPRGDITIYSEQARWLLQGKAVYRDFESAYAPLYPYLNSVLIRLSSAGLAIMFSAIVCEFFLFRLWLRNGRRLFTDAQVRVAALLYCTSALSVQYVAIDGQNNALTGLCITGAIFLLSRYRHLLSGFLLGLGIALVKFLPLLYAPMFFIVSARRRRWVAGLALSCVPVYGWFALRHYPLLMPLTGEGNLRSSGNVPFLVESLLGVALPGRLYDAVVLLALLAVFALVLRTAQGASDEVKLRALSFGTAAAVLALVMLSKKSWPPYLLMALFPLCLSIPPRRRNVLLLAVFSVAACTEPSAWWLAYFGASAAGIHAQLTARPGVATAFYLLELALVGGYAWLLWLAMKAMVNASRFTRSGEALALP